MSKAWGGRRLTIRYGLSLELTVKESAMTFVRPYWIQVYLILTFLQLGFYLAPSGEKITITTFLQDGMKSR